LRNSTPKTVVGLSSRAERYRARRWSSPGAPSSWTRSARSDAASPMKRTRTCRLSCGMLCSKRRRASIPGSPRTSTDCSRVLAESSRKWWEAREREHPVRPPSTHASAKIRCHISGGKMKGEGDGDLERRVQWSTLLLESRSITSFATLPSATRKEEATMEG
jgi:hypothetical protein